MIVASLGRGGCILRRLIVLAERAKITAIKVGVVAMAATIVGVVAMIVVFVAEVTQLNFVAGQKVDKSVWGVSNFDLNWPELPRMADFG